MVFGCVDAADANGCLGRFESHCGDLELEEDSCDCVSQVLVGGDCTAFFSCFSRGRTDCPGIFCSTPCPCLIDKTTLTLLEQRTSMWRRIPT